MTLTNTPVVLAVQTNWAKNYTWTKDAAPAKLTELMLRCLFPEDLPGSNRRGLPPIVP